MTPVFHQSELLRRTFLQHVEVFECLGSTQDRALAICGDSAFTLSALIVAERQTTGRGRDGASWWSPEGALLFSLVVPLPAKFAQPDNSNELSLSLAEAVADFLEEVLQSAGKADSVRVKPPNDIYIADAKIAGLLIDVPHQRNSKPRFAVLGIGLNVNNDGRNCPDDIKVPVTSISEQTGTKHDLQETLVSLLGHIERAVGICP